ncbi:HNH endonuclease [Kiloniella antarctica]|uniref:HNH endonuclease n=1 Tax=Kiloniella antarctica TaxID=1550907 RepID=A0ABW5BNN5_9PROT
MARKKTKSGYPKNYFDGKLKIINRMSREGARTTNRNVRVGLLYKRWLEHVGDEIRAFDQGDMVSDMVAWLEGTEENVCPIAIAKKKASREAKKTREEMKAFYASWDWKKLRYSVILEYGNKCMLCGSGPEHDRIVVDHIKPISKFPDLALEKDNLQVLCDTCNMGKSNIHFDDHRPSPLSKN